MFNGNPAFKKKALPMLVICVFLFYFYCGLYNDQLNVLQPYFMAQGWTSTSVTLPFTIGGYIVIVLYPIMGILMNKFGIKKILIPCMVIIAASMALMGVVSTNQTLYLIDLTIFRIATCGMHASAFLYCSNWFVFGRGRALGIVTAGAPLATATLIRMLSYGTNTMGIGPTYIIVAIAVLVLAVIITIFLKDKPEVYGLLPDGKDSIPDEQEGEENMTLKEVLSDKMAWPTFISYGLMGFMIVGVMAFYTVRMQMSGTDAAVYLTWLSIAALLGIPMSYVLGWIDDKIGTPKATIVLLIFGYILPLICLIIMSANNIPIIVLCAFGMATMTGGEPTLQASMTAYVFGRKRYNGANRWILSLEAIIMAFALPVISTILDKTGSLQGAYILMLVLTAICFVCTIIIGRRPDFDRG